MKKIMWHNKKLQREIDIKNKWIAITWQCDNELHVLKVKCQYGKGQNINNLLNGWNKHGCYMRLYSGEEYVSYEDADCGYFINLMKEIECIKKPYAIKKLLEATKPEIIAFWRKVVSELEE